VVSSQRDEDRDIAHPEWVVYDDRQLAEQREEACGIGLQDPPVPFGN
jgi:hypothetical protein